MPSELVAGIDRIERNRSRFIAEAVRHELQRRQRLELLRSLDAPHPATAATSSLGLAAWAEGLPAGDCDLLDPGAGTAVRWVQEVVVPVIKLRRERKDESRIVSVELLDVPAKITTSRLQVGLFQSEAAARGALGRGGQ